MEVLKSLIYRPTIKSVGPRIVPWVTPVVKLHGTRFIDNLIAVNEARLKPT